MIEYLPVIAAALLVLFLLGVLEVPIGGEKRVKWCGTGMHLHVYKKGGDAER